MQMRYLVFVFLMVACSPKVVTTLQQSSLPAVESQESFGVIESDTVSFDRSKFLGQVQIKDNGLAVNCDYNSVLELAKTEARQMGGNLLKIEEHKFPTMYGSTCHRIKASVYRVSNPNRYEKTILWNKDRKLIVEDFKGSTIQRPFQAATYSSIEYSIIKRVYRKGFNIEVKSRFFGDQSYFKRSESDSLVLTHEQLHFDITEIYARRFYQILKESNWNLRELREASENAYYDVLKQLALKQDEFDSEVYSNPDLLSKWQAWVQAELEKTAEFEVKTGMMFNR